MQFPELPTWKEIKFWVTLSAVVILAAGVGLGWLIFG
jgi:hypothetical protein